MVKGSKGSKEWSSKDVDNIYNGGAAFFGLLFLIADQIVHWNQNRGFKGVITSGFTGVGIGGTLAYVYLYSQGIYDKDFVPSDYKAGSKK